MQPLLLIAMCYQNYTLITKRQDLLEQKQMGFEPGAPIEEIACSTINLSHLINANESLTE